MQNVAAEHLGEVAVVADGDAETPALQLEDVVHVLAGCVVELLVVARLLRQVHHALSAGELALPVEYHAAVEEEVLRRLLVLVVDDGDVVVACQPGEPVHGRAGDRLAQLEELIPMRQAGEELEDGHLGKDDDVGPTLGGLLDQALDLLLVGVDVLCAVRLGYGDFHGGTLPDAEGTVKRGAGSLAFLE